MSTELENIESEIRRLIEKKRELLTGEASNDLKPCPFCGGPAEVVPNGPYVQCRDQQCCASVGPSPIWSLGEEATEAAIKAWNTRKKQRTT